MRCFCILMNLSGYNTDKALTVLPRFMPSPGQAKVRLMASGAAPLRSITAADRFSDRLLRSK